MTNHEKYRNASSIIKPSAEFATKVLKEAKKMESKNSVKRTPIFRGKRRLATLAASLALVFCLATVSYAMNFAGFKKNVDSWRLFISYPGITHLLIIASKSSCKLFR